MDLVEADFHATFFTQSRDRFLPGTAYGTAEWHNPIDLIERTPGLTATLAAEGARSRPRTQRSTSTRPA
jgi:hypothetical protein